MTSFYHRLSNCQPHHTVQILVVSTTVLTMTTTHNTALGKTVPECTTLPLSSKSQRTHLSTVNVHNARLIDSAHFAQPMSYDSKYHSPSLVHLCHDSPTSSTRIVSYYTLVDSTLELSQM
jgi:hypothetical protein